MAKRKGVLPLTALWTAGLAIIVLVVVIGVGASIVGQIKNVTTDTTAVAVLQSGLDALSDFGDWLPIIVIAVVAVIVLGLIVGGLGGFSSRGGE